MNKTTKLTITIFTLALLLISGCATQTTQTATQSRENTQDKMLTDKLPIRIGLILPLTGPSADFGNLFKESAVMAAEDLNNGGKLNRRVELVFEDTGGDPKNAVTAMQKMINVEGIKLFSSITSSHALALKPVAVENNVLLFHSAAHPKINTGEKMIFGHSNTADDEAATLARKIIELEAKKAGIIVTNEDYGLIFNNELVKNLEAAGIKTHSELYDPKTNDLRTEVSKAMDGSDTLVIGGFGPGVALAIKQASELGFNGNKVIGIAFTIQHLDKLEDLVEGAYYPTYPFTEYKSYPHFVASFKKKYGKDPDLFHPVPYGLIETLATAADKAGSDDAEKVATTLRETGKFEGAYETLSFNANQMAKVPLITSVYHRNGTSTPGE